VESGPGAGTTFDIYMPASPKAQAVQHTVKESAPLSRVRILIMDDEDDARDVAGTMLNRAGYQVRLARDGAETIERYGEALVAGDPFAAVVLDLTVPGGMGARETIARLREADPAVKAIVASGYSRVPIMANYREHGFVGVVTKPYRIEELCRTLSGVLRSTA